MLESNLQVQTKNILNNNHFHSIRRLGKGGFGHVLLATKATSSSTYYAVKCISKKKMIKDPLLKKFLFQEINTMACLDHANIVKLHKTFEEGEWYFLVMEYCDMGNLYNFQNKLNNRAFTKEESVNIFNQILRGVELIHKSNIIHRDLKMENIFLKKNPKNGNFICKIGDFGLARELEGGTAITNCGTQIYMAPQILAGTKYDKKADIWSLGVLLFYLLTGDFPFKGINILNDVQIKCSQGYSLMDHLQKTKVANSFKSKKQEIVWSDLFAKIFMTDPNNRINLSDLKEHPVLKKKDQNTYYQMQSQELISTNQDDNSDQATVQWEINRILYLQNIVNTIEKHSFLSKFLLTAYKFYMNKVLLYFLNKDSIKKFKKEQNGICCSSNKLMKAITHLQEDVIANLSDLHSKLLQLLANSSEKEEIEKLGDGLNVKYQDFTEFKMAYRNTVGRIYEEVHRKFADNSYERAVLKLKVFICHIANRVFSGSSVNENLWPHFFGWLKTNRLPYSSRYYDFRLLQEWMRHEKTENLQRSQEIINQMFYK